MTGKTVPAWPVSWRWIAALWLPAAMCLGLSAGLSELGAVDGGDPAQHRPPAQSIQVAQAAGATDKEPADPRAAKARAVLESHCARCHQRNMLRQPAPAKDLGDILDLDRLASDSGLVIAGNADASPIYTLMLRREMPFDVAQGTSKADGPTADEIEALRDWIEALAPRPVSCSHRTRVTPQSTIQSIRGALSQERGDAAGLRFVSLAHLYNTCASEATMQTYRQAVTKLVNSLSAGPAPVRLETAGMAGTLLKIRLASLGWDAAQWEKLTQGNPAGGLAGFALPAGLAQRFGTAHPVVPGDWLAAAAARPQVYYDMLGQPARLDDLLRGLGVDHVKGAATGARRIGLRVSAVTRGHRLIEYRGGPGGAVWLAYDFAGTDGRRDIFAHPLGPSSEISGAQPFKADAVRVMFSLRNGFPGYAVYDGDGQRLNAVPAEIEFAQPHGRNASAAGLACASCHVNGPARVGDDLHTFAQGANSRLPRGVRDAVMALHKPNAEMQQVFDAEKQRHLAAMKAAGIDADVRINGVEAVAALAKVYTRSLPLERAGEDFGEDATTFKARLAAAEGDARLIAARLQHGPIPRAEAIRLYSLLAAPTPAGREDAAQAAPAATPGAGDVAADLALVSDKTSYKVGEAANFTVRSNVDCNLTVINVNAAGKAIVIFPNDFEPDNALTAGKALQLPRADSSYRLRFTQAGTERVIGICSPHAKLADSIQQDFERQRFTALGDWRNFLRALVNGETPMRRAAEKAETRGKSKAQSAKAKEPEPPVRNRFEAQTRTGLVIRVEEAK